MEAIHRAVALGVNWLDTAAVYGLGHSEAIVGKAVAALPAAERPFIFTKCGLVWDEKDRTAEPRRVLQPASIRRECEASLTRLGVERIDLYQFHWPDETGTAVEDSWDTMLRLVEEGKVRWGGVCNFDVGLLSRCAARGGLQSLQPPFSPIRRKVAGAELPWCAAHDVGVIAYSPMQSGLLTDGFSAARLRRASARRLPPPRLGVHAAPLRPQSRAPRRARPRRQATRMLDRGDRHRLGAGVARGHGRHRRREVGGAGGRVDRRGRSAIVAGGPR